MRNGKNSAKCAARHITEDVLRRFAIALACTLALSMAIVATAGAQPFDSEELVVVSTPRLLFDTGAAMPRIYGVARPLTPHWKASYGLGLADETALSTSFMRLDELFDSGELDSRGSRENWRHFLGLEFAPVESFALLGGIAKASGVNGGKAASVQPTGYERLRLNTGARWRGDDWGIDGSFSFIPNGPTRWPGEAGFLPSMGDTGPTWLFSLAVSRRF